MNRALTFLLTLISPLSLISSTIYEEITPIPFDGIGYFAAEKMLDNIFKKQNIKTVIEIGSWAGASTRFLANRVGEGGKVYAIDHWLGTPEHPGEMKDRRLSNIYHLFLSNIRKAGLEDRIVPLRMSSNEGLKALEHVNADLIFIDGPRNQKEVYEAVVKWHSHLKETGIICGTEWREKSIREGVMQASQELDLSIQHDKKGATWLLY